MIASLLVFTVIWALFVGWFIWDITRGPLSKPVVLPSKRNTVLEVGGYAIRPDDMWIKTDIKTSVSPLIGKDFSGYEIDLTLLPEKVRKLWVLNVEAAPGQK